MEISTDFLKNTSEKMYRLKRDNKFLTQKNLIVVLLVILLLTSTLYLLNIRSQSRYSANGEITTNPLNVQPIETIDWDINIPNDHDIRTDGTFENEYFSIFYEEWSGNYKLNVYQGAEFSLASIKEFLDPKLEEFADFTVTDSLTNVIYVDKRDVPKPTLEIIEDHND